MVFNVNTLYAFILGLVQGLTEYLPVSSSGHLVLFQTLFGLEGANLSFDITLHVATCCSTVFVFRERIKTLLVQVFSTHLWNAGKRYALLLIVSNIPIFIVGIYFNDQLESMYRNNLLLVGCCFILTSIFLFISEHLPLSFRFGDCVKKEIGYKDAFIIGLSQMIAVLPGLSRSGTTIATGLLCKINKDRVTEFSFIMVLIPVFGKVVIDIVSNISQVPEMSISFLYTNLIGFVTSFVIGIIACRGMIKIVQRSRLSVFSYYCFVLGVVTLFYEFYRG